MKRLEVLAASVIASIVLILLASDCGSTRQAQQSLAKPRATSAGVSALLGGIRQRGSTLGDPSAPVTVQYFADLQCPYCRLFTLRVLPSLIRTYVRSGKLQIVFRSVETATHDPETFKLQQIAALAAGKQNKLWDFIDLFYLEQRYLQGLAQQVSGLDLIEWSAARADPRLARALAGDARAAVSAGINSTPTFLIAHARYVPYLAALERQLRGGASARFTL